MATTIELAVRGWPGQVRLSVTLKDATNNQPVSGNVRLAIRIGNDRGSTRNLGGQGQELVILVDASGTWTSPSTWDWTYWKNAKFDTLIAEHNRQFKVYNLDRPASQQDRTPRATSISKIQIIDKGVDTANPDKKKFVLAWTILDQFGKQIAGSVTTAFEGNTQRVTSLADKLGTCVANASVGSGEEKVFTVFPPVGDPVAFTLKGPEKPPPDPTAAALSDISYSARPHPTDPSKLLYLLYWTVIGSDGKAFINAPVPRMFNGSAVNIPADANGLYGEPDVEVSGYNAEMLYSVFIPGSTHQNAHKSVALKGPEKKTDVKFAQVTAISVLNAHDGTINCAGFNSAVEVALAFEEGKPKRSVELYATTNCKVDFSNGDTGAPLGANVLSCKVVTDTAGTLRLCVDFLACEQNEVTVRMYEPISQKSATVTLKYKMF